MENYWKQLKEKLESGAENASAGIRDGKEIFHIEPSENEFRLSLLHGGEPLVKLTITKAERSIDLHTVLANGKEISGAYEIRDGHLASVNSDSIYFADAAHAASHFLRPATYAIYDPPFNIPKR